MKKTILMVSMAGMLFLSGLAVAQDMPSAKKDSINADKAAKPVFYDAATEEQTPKSDSGMNYALVGGVIVVVGAAGYFLMRKKKN